MLGLQHLGTQWRDFGVWELLLQVIHESLAVLDRDLWRHILLGEASQTRRNWADG